MKRDTMNDEKTTKMKHLIFGPREKCPYKKRAEGKAEGDR